MGFLDKIKELTRPYDDEEEEFEDFSAHEAERIPVTPRTASAPRPASSGFGSPLSGYGEKRDANKVVNIHATTQLQVVLAKP